MKKLKELWSTLPETVTVTRTDGILIVTISALVGVIIGMLCSPKKYISIAGSSEEINSVGSSDDQVEEVSIWEEDEDIMVK